MSAATRVLLGCGIIPALASEMVPGEPVTAVSLQKSSEQSGIFVGQVVVGALIAAMGYSSAIIGYGAIAILGSLILLAGVNEPGLSGAEQTA